MKPNKSSSLPKTVIQEIVVISCADHGAHTLLVSGLEADVVSAAAEVLTRNAERAGFSAYHTARVSSHPSTDIDLRSHRWASLAATLAEGSKAIYADTLDRDEIPF